MPVHNLLLPQNWPKRIRSAMLSVVSVAHAAIIHTRSFAANSPIHRVRLSAELDRAKEEIAHIREGIRIKDARCSSTPQESTDRKSDTGFRRTFLVLQHPQPLFSRRRSFPRNICSPKSP